jgi:hypothetical protein
MIRLVAPLAVLSLVIFVTAYALKPRLRAASFVALRHLCIALGGAAAVLLIISIIFMGWT